MDWEGVPGKGNGLLGEGTYLGGNSRPRMGLQGSITDKIVSLNSMPVLDV